MGKKLNLLQIIVFAVIASLYSCSGGGSDTSSDTIDSKRAGINEVIIHSRSDPQSLNPITTSDATASEILKQTHQMLLSINHETFELMPELAVERPVIEVIEENGESVGMTMDFEIRPEATWDNGDPITGHDYAFTLKTIKCPTVTEAGSKRPYFKFIDDVVVDEENPKKFRLICNKVYALAEPGAANTVEIIPAYAYDPNGVLAKFSIPELNNPDNADRLKGNEELVQFAKDFTSEKFQREAEYIVGSGPYKFEKWETGQRLVLTKKENWWGESLVGNEYAFANYPEKLTYEIITDLATSLSAVRDEALDVSNDFSSKVFVEDLMEDQEFQKLYNLYTPPWIYFSYIGMNMRNPKLADRNVRVAISHCYDAEYVMEIFLYGLAEYQNGPFHPSQEYYNDTIERYAFDIEKAKSILDEAGWVDSDGNGVRDKMIDGEKIELNVSMKFPPGSATTENIMLLFQKNLEEAGINMQIVTREWTVFLDELDAHDFDLYGGAWVNDPGPNDPYQLWHTESYNGGSNYCGFGDAESDALIEAIQKELDPEKRHDMYMRFQEMTHYQAPYIFNYTVKKKVATHARFDNAEGKATRVGYVPNKFILNPSYGGGAKAVPAE